MAIRPGASSPDTLRAVCRGRNRVDLSWTPVNAPDLIGYRLYRRTDLADPTPADLVTPEILTGTAASDTAAPAYRNVSYSVSAVRGTEAWVESLPSRRATVFTRPDSTGPGLLVVNDYDWMTYSDGPYSLYVGDPYELYASRALTGNAAFDFWDMRKGWTVYPPGYVPLGTGEIDPDVLFAHGAVLWAANGLDSSEDERIEELADLLAAYHEAGGAIFFAGWTMNAYLPEEMLDILNITGWDRPVSLTPARRLVSQVPELGDIHLAPEVASAPYCDVPRIHIDPGIRIYYRPYVPDPPVLMFSSSDLGTVRTFLLSANPALLDTLDLRQNVAPILEALAADSLEVGVPGGPPSPPRLSAPHPNPFRGAVRVEFRLDAAGPVTAEVVDVAGRRVRTLAEGRLPAGTHRLQWDGRDGAGRPTAAGVYFLRVSTQEFNSRRRLVRLP